ncbi:heterokaryon incompatibility protein-domain-containing protein [Cladorrhinum samala]|uniref:Heterokaryon incompatibility protein-domain-containing protein n=1 Tax=Cladorrhinum samala TaxID=585594 RepID=A0AAV9HZM5_9PEZI|nr:heterokaryon incompatibility protein-domain-containing protein [Cladorrhinum samala]
MSSTPYHARCTENHLSGLGQVLTLVSEANKEDLLQEASKTTHNDDSHARALYILAHLKRLNPEVAQNFHSKQDMLANLAFRMICSASGSDASSAGRSIPTFVVVSYCWHNPSWSLAPCQKGKDLVPGWEISRPMMDAVLGARTSPMEGVWLDKMCIDQSDEDDRDTHIAVMDTIYRSARRMVILLEDVQLTKEEESSALVFAEFYADMCRGVRDAGLDGAEKNQFVKDFFPQQEKKYHDLHGGESLMPAAESFAMKVLSARWFSRAWCVHESKVHPHRAVNNPLFMCFSSSAKVLSFEFRYVSYLALYLINQKTEAASDRTGNPSADGDPRPTATLQQLWWQMGRLLPRNESSVSALQQLASIQSFGCTMKEDLISIALNTAGIPISFKQKLQSVEDVIWNFSLLVLATGDLVPLIASGSNLTLTGTQGTEVISWAIKPTQTPLESRVLNPLPWSITAITKEYIELDILVFRARPRKASVASLEVASRLIQDHDLSAVTMSMLAASSDYVRSSVLSAVAALNGLKGSRASTSTRLSDFVQNALALNIDSGIDWIFTFADHMVSSTQDWHLGTLGDQSESSPDARIEAAAASLLASTAVGNASTPRTTSIKPAIMRFFTCLLDPRLLLLHFSPRFISLPSFMGSGAFTPKISDRSYLAIPAALAHLPGWYDRAWVVEQFNPSGPPEDPRDYLPSMEHVLEGGQGEVKIQDVAPVLTTDDDIGQDRRPGIDLEKRDWKRRNRQPLYACPQWNSSDMIKHLEETKEARGDILLLKRQRIYGAEDYRWEEIAKGLAAVQNELQKRREGGLQSSARQ